MLRFEPNNGQFAPGVQFVARGMDYMAFLTSTDVVLVFPERGTHDAVSSRRHAPPGGTSGPPTSVLRMCFLGANEAAEASGVDKLSSWTNYFPGNDPSRWVKGVPHFAGVRVEGVYPDVDLLWCGDDDRLEYGLVLGPEARINDVIVGFEGLDGLALDAQGGLVLTLKEGTIRQSPPVLYEQDEGATHRMAGGYVLKDGHSVGFEVEPRDPARELVIDPELEFSTYLGGSAYEEAYGVALDSNGVNAYVTGGTASINFPPPPFPPIAGARDAFVTKFNVPDPAADPPPPLSLVWSSVFGGGSEDIGQGIAFSYCLTDNPPTATPWLIVTGETSSNNFPHGTPATPWLGNPSFPGGGLDAFVARLDPADGDLKMSTYLGGSDTDIGTVILGFHDRSCRCFVAGTTWSPDFPVSLNAYQPGRAGTYSDGFFAMLGLSGLELTTPPRPWYGTYFGGPDERYDPDYGGDGVYGMAVGRPAGTEQFLSGGVYLTGYTDSYRTTFPHVALPIPPLKVECAQRLGGGVQDMFVAKLRWIPDFPPPPDNGHFDLAYSTFLGGSGVEQGMSIAVDDGGWAYISGQTTSDDFPVLHAFQPDRAPGPGMDGTVTKLDPTGTRLAYSTYLGGFTGETPPPPMTGDCGTKIAIDAAGRVHVSGPTDNSDFPAKNYLYTYGGDEDTFAIELTPSGEEAYYSTFLGGGHKEYPGSTGAIAVDTCGRTYLVGSTESALPARYPLVRGVVGHADLRGIRDAFMSVVMNADTKQEKLLDPFYCSPASDPACRFVCDMTNPPAGCPAGTGECSFCPEAPVTREELAQILLQAAYNSAITDPRFTWDNGPPQQEFVDVPVCSPFYGWVQRAAHLGFANPCRVAGFPGGQPAVLKWYCPERPVTREEAALMLFAFAFQTSRPLQLVGQCQGIFCDLPSGFCAVAEAFFNANPEIEGGCGCYCDIPGGVRMFCPDEPLSRKEIAKWVRNWIDLPTAPCQNRFDDVTPSTPVHCRAAEALHGRVGGPIIVPGPKTCFDGDPVGGPDCGGDCPQSCRPEMQLRSCGMHVGDLWGTGRWNPVQYPEYSNTRLDSGLDWERVRIELPLFAGIDDDCMNLFDNQGNCTPQFCTGSACYNGFDDPICYWNQLVPFSCSVPSIFTQIDEALTQDFDGDSTPDGKVLVSITEEQFYVDPGECELNQDHEGENLYSSCVEPQPPFTQWWQTNWKCYAEMIARYVADRWPTEVDEGRILFECHNEPDNAGRFSDGATLAQATLKCVQGIKAVIPSARVLAPSLRILRDAFQETSLSTFQTDYIDGLYTLPYPGGGHLVDELWGFSFHYGYRHQWNTIDLFKQQFAAESTIHTNPKIPYFYNTEEFDDTVVIDSMDGALFVAEDVIEHAVRGIRTMIYGQLFLFQEQYETEWSDDMLGLVYAQRGGSLYPASCWGTGPLDTDRKGFAAWKMIEPAMPTGTLSEWTDAGQPFLRVILSEVHDDASGSTTTYLIVANKSTTTNGTLPFSLCECTNLIAEVLSDAAVPPQPFSNHPHCERDGLGQLIPVIEPQSLVVFQWAGEASCVYQCP